MSAFPIVVLVLCLAGGLTARAEEAPASDLTAPDVVVSATRVPLPSSAVPAATTTIPADAIQRTPFRDGSQTDDLLRYVPEVQPANLSSRYNHPTAQAVSLRGLGVRRALVLLDGVPLNDGFGGWINWGLVPNAVDRIEVAPGGGSNVYGTWAMGGVVQVFTESPRLGRGARAEARGGNLGTTSDSITAHYGGERAGVLVSGRWFHTNGYITVPAYQRGPLDQNNEATHGEFHARARAALTSRTAATLSGDYFREDRQFGTPLSDASRTIGMVSGGLEGETPGGDQWQAKLFAQWQTFKNLTGTIIPGTPQPRSVEFRDRIQTIPSNDFGGTSQYRARLNDANDVVIGVDARAIIGRSEDQLFTIAGPAGGTIGGGKQVGGGVFGEWITRPVDRLTVIPSFRADWWKNFDGRIQTANGTTTVPADRTATALNPKLAAQYAVTDRVRAGGSFYQAFRAPTLNELYRDFSFGGFAFFNANPNLGPERLTGGDAKLEADLLPDRMLTARLVGHYDEVRNAILFVTESPTVQRRQNVGRTRSTGFDVTVEGRVHEWLAWTAGYAYTDAVITDFAPDASRVGKRVPNVSAHQLVGTATVGTLDTLQLTLMARYLSKQFADDLNTQPIADFVVLDASLQRRIARHWRLAVDAENLTDRQYIATQTGSIKTLGSPLAILGSVRAEF